MNKFYESISKYYSRIFPSDNKKTDFLLDACGDGMYVLDVACGSGETAKAMMEAGKDVVGIDYEVSMVSEARKNGIRAYSMDMRSIELDEKFDLIYCIGNSISHLKSLDEVDEYLFQMPLLLNHGGCFVIQIINYFGIWDDNAKDGAEIGQLPTIEKDNLTFERKYFRDGDMIRFHTRLTTEDGVLINDQELLPIQPDKLIDYIVAMGFDVELYGSFDRESIFDLENSQNFIIEARRR